MPIVRAQVIFQGGTGIPEDRFINTWHFDAATYNGTLTDSIEQKLTNFYTAVNTPQTVPVGYYLSEFVSRNVEIRMYNLDDPEPRVPTFGGFVLAAAPAGENLPEEVAVVVSLEAPPPITRNRRGRLYIGPLNANCLTDATGATPTRPNADMRNVLAAAATRVLNENVEPGGWVIWSPTTGTSAPVASGFIDNAFDTQRRRGPDATTRTIFPLP